MPATAARKLHILLPTLGSAGDVNPFIGIGVALRQRGHRVTLITNEIFSQAAQHAGLEFIAMGNAAEVDAALDDPRMWHPIRSFEFVVERAVAPNLERLHALLVRHASANTVVAASSLCFGARVAQETHGLPLATVHLQPALLRSLVDYGTLGMLPMGPRTPRWLKRAVFRLSDVLITGRHLNPPLNAFRARFGLPPVRDVFGGYVHSPQLVLALFPEWLAPAQPDWPRNTHQTGFVLYDAGNNNAVPEGVEEFLASGPPPVVITPGSAAATLNDFFKQSIEACRLANVRAMLVTNFAQQLPPKLPRDVRAFPYVPFSKVLHRSAAIVYHGGIGTLAQAVRARIPQLVVPQAYDQPDNAARVERLNLGKSIPAHRYTAARAARALRDLLESPTLTRTLGECAARMDPAAALTRTCELIEQLGSPGLLGVHRRTASQLQ